MKGVTTNSSGNHATAVSYISGKFNVKNKIIMPENSPGIKQASVRGFGGDIVFCESTDESRAAMQKTVCQEYDYEFIPGGNHENIITG